MKSGTSIGLGVAVWLATTLAGGKAQRGSGEQEEELDHNGPKGVDSRRQHQARKCTRKDREREQISSLRSTPESNSSEPEDSE